MLIVEAAIAYMRQLGSVDVLPISSKLVIPSDPEPSEGESRDLLFARSPANLHAFASHFWDSQDRMSTEPHGL
jgi:hypothetical protein